MSGWSKGVGKLSIIYSGVEQKEMAEGDTLGSVMANTSDPGFICCRYNSTEIHGLNSGKKKQTHTKKTTALKNK